MGVMVVVVMREDGVKRRALEIKTNKTCRKPLEKELSDSGGGNDNGS